MGLRKNFDLKKERIDKCDFQYYKTNRNDTVKIGRVRERELTTEAHH